MEQWIAIGVGAGIFLLMWMVVIPRVAGVSGAARTRGIIDKIAASGSQSVGSATAPLQEDEEDVAANFKSDASGLAKLLLSLPKAEAFYVLILKAGRGAQVSNILLAMIVLFVIVAVVLFPLMGGFSLIPAALLTFFIPRFIFRREIRKRNQSFVDMFPEAIDMIVRSVKSGHPLNTALRMIGDNMEDPVGSEFRQVINEVSYGRPLIEALRRLAKRIDEPDVHFFVVVLAVQQETGGNLAEILGNLSSVIRGRKQLFQKIRAMTSEGRATLWVLGSLPIIQFGAVFLTSPDYVQPLFDTTPGNIVLSIAISLVLLAIWIVNQMIDVDV